MKHIRKTKKTVVPPRKIFLWECYNDTQLRLWPKNSKITYFSSSNVSRDMPQNLITKCEGDICEPESLPIDILQKHSILLMGFAHHGKDYYHSRINANFNDMMIVTKGKLTANFDSKKVKLSCGDALIVPYHCLCDSYVECGCTNIAWIHFKNTQFWNNIFENKIFTKRLDYFYEIHALMNLYCREIYKKYRSVDFLESLTGSIVTLLQEEFQKKEPFDDSSAIKNFLREIESHLKEKLTTSKIAENFSISTRDLDEYCLKVYASSFSKFVLKNRMKTALKLLKNGCTSSQIAKEIGYADPYTFSKAFKSFYGKSPNNLRK